MNGLYVCRCVCKRPFTTICPSLTECPRCAAGRLLARPVADAETATERLLFARLLFEAEGNNHVDQGDAEFNEFGIISEFGAEPLPEEDDAAVTALLIRSNLIRSNQNDTGHLPPRRPKWGWLEWALFLMICVVAWLLWLTGIFIQ